MTKHIYNDIFVHHTNSLTGINAMTLTFSPRESLPQLSIQDNELNYKTFVQLSRSIVSSTLLFAKNDLSIPRNKKVITKLIYRINQLITTIRSFKLKYKSLFRRYH